MTSTKTIEFINKAKKIHGDRYEYHSVEYVNNHTKIKLFCKVHGFFEQSPSVHLRGSNCRKCAHIYTTEEFTELARKKHGDLYDYSLVEYAGCDKEVTIICKHHGVFNKAPKNHLKGGNCPECVKMENAKNQTLTTQEFIEKAKAIHGDTYCYENTIYRNSKTKSSIFCKKHGFFEQTPSTHLNNHGCQKCGRKASGWGLKTHEQFIEEAKEVHGDKYIYDEANYEKGSIKVVIRCRQHGLFNQTPNNHIKGQGCPKCKNENQKGGYGKNDYVERVKDKICTFYTIRCFNDEEEFYKIGITSNTVKERYGSTRAMPYNYEIISEVFGEAGTIWDMEKENMQNLKEFHYSPNIEFKGSKTECFTKYNAQGV